jgi:hypothetical protein
MGESGMVKKSDVVGLAPSWGTGAAGVVGPDANPRCCLSDGRAGTLHCAYPLCVTEKSLCVDFGLRCNWPICECETPTKGQQPATCGKRVNLFNGQRDDTSARPWPAIVADSTSATERPCASEKE